MAAPVTSSAADRDQRLNGINRPRSVLTLLAIPVYFALFLFLPAGNFAWVTGWVFMLVFLVTAILSVIFLWRVNPEVIIARSHPHQGTKSWDKILFSLMLPSFLAIVPVAALDAGRFHWSSAPSWVYVLGYILLLIGFWIVTWAQAVNRFFEPTVRIQKDRGHQVVCTGPYALVRHPGYVGLILLPVSFPLCLGSLAGLIATGLSVLSILLRTDWEDQTLQAELEGYSDYAQRVRYRLIPGVW